MISKLFFLITFSHLLTFGSFLSNVDPSIDLMFLANQYLHIFLHQLHLNLLLWGSDYQDLNLLTEIIEIKSQLFNPHFELVT